MPPKTKKNQEEIDALQEGFREEILFFMNLIHRETAPEELRRFSFCDLNRTLDHVERTIKRIRNFAKKSQALEKEKKETECTIKKR